MKKATKWTNSDIKIGVQVSIDKTLYTVVDVDTGINNKVTLLNFQDKAQFVVGWEYIIGDRIEYILV